MKASVDSYLPGREDLYFLALGGAGEIGMNLNLYGHDGQWLMVDLGVTFGDDRMPGVDVVMADPAFIVERANRLAGLVLTHAHEDHLGAVAYLWPRLKCPVYATPFTAAVLRAKLDEAGLTDQVPLTVVPLGGRFQVGVFDVELITLTHSIPEPNGLALRTPAGTILHTGDWKLDPDPLIGAPTDEAALRALGEEGVLAMVCDSTNALVPGWSGSEAAARTGLIEVIGGCTGRVVVACFASNIARLESIAHAAAVHGRRVCLVGRSLWRIYGAARNAGYLDHLPPFLTDRDAGYLPPSEVLLICTGSQGEPRSALPRLVAGHNQEIALEKGDTAIFSSRIIPGNEKEIAHLQDRLVEMGVGVITSKDAFVHVSGHPAQDELIQMYQWVRPTIAVPVHGEAPHMREHARLAADCQVPQTPLIENGDILRLAPGAAEIIGKTPTGRLCVDGKRLLALRGSVMRERGRITYDGAVVATLVVDGHGDLLGAPQLSAPGLLERDDVNGVLDGAVDEIRRAIDGLSTREAAVDDAVREAARRAVRRVFRTELGKKPVIDIHLVRV